MKGFEVLRAIRARSGAPVLMLTARGDEQDRILGLEMGADDYLPKPFNPRELSARVSAILRRARVAPPGPEWPADTTLRVGDIELRAAARAVFRGSQALLLTTVEFDLLHVLLGAAGRILSREELARTVLGREFSPFDRSIDVHVCNLRRKLGPHPDRSERIKGVRGVGYLYAAPGSSRGGDRETTALR